MEMGAQGLDVGDPSFLSRCCSRSRPDVPLTGFQDLEHWLLNRSQRRKNETSSKAEPAAPTSEARSPLSRPLALTIPRSDILAMSLWATPPPPPGRDTPASSQLPRVTISTAERGRPRGDRPDGAMTRNPDAGAPPHPLVGLGGVSPAYFPNECKHTPTKSVIVVVPTWLSSPKGDSCHFISSRHSAHVVVASSLVPPSIG